MGSIPVIPEALNVPLLLCHERFNEPSLPTQHFTRSDLPQAVCIIPQALRYATQRMLTVRMHCGRTRTPEQCVIHLPPCFNTYSQRQTVKDEVLKRITNPAGGLVPEQRAQCSVLMQEFLGGGCQCFTRRRFRDARFYRRRGTIHSGSRRRS